MSDSLRLLTYNVQMRPWAAEVGVQGTLKPVTTEKERAHAIADRILAAPRGYDVLCFTEVFDEDGREVLQKRLRAEFPHMVLKAEADDEGGGALSLVMGGLALVVPVFGWAVALGAGAFALAGGAVWEDSGLMLCSRKPFGQIPVPPLAVELFQAHGLPVPASIPNVAFVAYEDAEDSDANASKGVLYAEIRPKPNERVHVLVSHTQADPTDKVGKHASVRTKQLEQVRGLVEAMAGPPPWQEEVIFCGDLNVNGMVDELGQRPEWEAVFDNQPPDAGWLTHSLHDVWYREQCPGDIPGTTPLPEPCDPGPTNHVQRLDYFLRPPNSFPDRRMTQHIWIAHDIAQDAGRPLAYNSDHLPLAIDLARGQPHCSAITAEPIAVDLQRPDFVSPEEVLFDGQMHWYRIKEPGGYGIGLVQGEEYVDVDVFTFMDMSRPKPAFTSTRGRVDESPPLTRYALPATPWFIRVAMKDRGGEAPYQLWVHRYGGRSRRDAIPLTRRVPTTGVAHPGELHSFDDASTPFSEHDAVWFKIWLDTPPPGRRTVADSIVLTDVSDRAFGVLMFADTPAGPEVLGETGGGGDPVILQVDHREPGWAYILVRREVAPSASASRFTITFRSDMSYLYSDQSPESRAFGSAMLFCVDETDGLFPASWPWTWVPGLTESGSDDIAINISAGGQTVVHIPHSDMLLFDDDTRRNVDAPVVAYADEVEYELVELDDFSPVDRAHVRIPQFDDVIASAERLVRVEPDRIEASFPINFEDDDGHYHLTVTVSAEPPVRP